MNATVWTTYNEDGSIRGQLKAYHLIGFGLFAVLVLPMIFQ